MMNNYTPKQYIELFHLLFLDQLGRKLDKKLYVLKGGCNLRFYFHSIRYSEDIDIDIKTIAKTTLTNKVRGILNSTIFQQTLQSKNIAIQSISEPKQTDTTQRWKLILKITQYELPLHTKIEFSRRGPQDGTAFEAINLQIIRLYELPPIILNHYDAKTAFSQKLTAIISRNRTQARDLFDLYILLNFLEEKNFQNKKLQNLFSQAHDFVFTVSFKDFQSQVLPYLPQDYQAQYNTEAVWSNIVLKVADSLEATLK